MNKLQVQVKVEAKVERLGLKMIFLSDTRGGVR